MAEEKRKFRLLKTVYMAVSSVSAFMLGVRRMTGTRVQRIFLRRYNLSLKTGKNERDALLSSITFFRYKKPFVYLSDRDVQKLLDTSAPVLVAKLFKECVEARNVMPIRERVSPREYTMSDYFERIYEDARGTYS